MCFCAQGVGARPGCFPVVSEARQLMLDLLDWPGHAYHSTKGNSTSCYATSICLHSLLDFQMNSFIETV